MNIEQNLNKYRLLLFIHCVRIDIAFVYIISIDYY